MPQRARAIALDQALSFLAYGQELVADADFKALGSAIPTDNSACDRLILAARQGALKLSGTLCVTVADSCFPGQQYYSRDGQVTAAKPPKLTKHELVQDFSIATEHIVRDQMIFEHSTIVCEGIPTGAPELKLNPPLKVTDEVLHHFNSVRADETELRALRSKYAEERKSEPKTRYTHPPGKLMAEVVAIVHNEGFEEPSLTSLIEKVQERLGEDGPKLSHLKEVLGPIFHHPELQEVLRGVRQKATARPRRNSKGFQ